MDTRSRFQLKLAGNPFIAALIASLCRPSLQEYAQEMVNAAASTDGPRRALDIAAAQGYEALAKALLKSGHRISHTSCISTVAYQGGRHPDPMVRSSLDWAAGNGQDRIVRLFLSQKVRPDDLQLAMNWAAVKGHASTVKLLQNKRVDTRNCLFMAVYRGHEDVTRVLVSWGADRVAGASFTETLVLALVFGLKATLYKIRGLSLERWTYQYWRYDHSFLHEAARGGKEKIVQLLLDRGYNKDACDNHGMTAFLFAARNGHESVVRLLLGLGVNIERPDCERYTALHFAALNGREAVVRILLDHGANKESETLHKHTALRLAEYRTREAVVQLLVDRGAIKQMNVTGTPFIWIGYRMEEY